MDFTGIRDLFKVGEVQLRSAAEPLKSGHIIAGKIQKLFPRQTAEVILGGRTVIAKLEAPLEAGKRYLLQVQPVQDGKLVLKVIAPALEKGRQMTGTSSQVLTHMGIPQTQHSKDLAGLMLKNGWPIEQADFEKSLQWLESAKNPNIALESIRHMHSKGLPFADDVFYAMQEQAKGDSLHQLLSGLLHLLKEEGNVTNTAKELKPLLENMVLSKREGLQGTGVQKLIEHWLSKDIPREERAAAFSLLQKAGFIQAGHTEKSFLTDVLSVAGNIKQAESKAEGEALRVLQTISALQQQADSGRNAVLKGILSRIPDLNIGEKNGTPTELAMQWLQNKAENNKGEFITRLLTRLVGGQHAPSSNEASAEWLLAAGKNHSGLTPLEQRVLSNVETNTLRGETEQNFSMHLKKLISLLGLQLENSLSKYHSGQGNTEPEMMLKPLLLKLLAESQPEPIKEAAGQLVQKLTAQQLSFRETGPLQQFQVTVPLILKDWKTDLTMEWSGRKKEDGSIDPEFCRIIFYLNLEQLAETVIDVQIQGEVITMTIANQMGEQMDRFAAGHVETMRESLDRLGYRLSGIVFKQSGQDGTAGMKKSGSAAPKEIYDRLDIRI
ncbi:hypothetical protein [Bacillus massiliglaciei]|uniref:hypothetical protein n=1 Tax=Bacillus massiliglaciei TaxID=1816693 RepID=UPI000DA5F7E8|nr:hypothetical protein [Bacillus massiliglaciei]